MKKSSGFLFLILFSATLCFSICRTSAFKTSSGHDCADISNFQSSMNLPSSERPSLPPLDPISRDELIRRISCIRHNPVTDKPIPFLGLDSAEALPDWLWRIETDLKDAGIPAAQWSDAAIFFLEGPVNTKMRQQRQRRAETGLDDWSWDDFKVALLDALTDRVNLSSEAEHRPLSQDDDIQSDASPSAIQRFRKDHPHAMTVAGAGLVIAGGAVLGPVAFVAGLNAVGFTSSGIAAGSIATGLQSAVYGGAASGLFASCQSIAATAVAPSLGVVMSSFGGVLAGAGLIGSSQGVVKESNVDSSEPPISDSAAPPP